MDPNSVKFDASRRLSQLLAEARDWPLPSRLRLIRRLGEQLGSLHGEGRLHRRVEAEEVAIDEQFRPLLSDPAESRRFGGECSDPEYCPAELAADGSEGKSKRLSVELPADIEAAGSVLREHGHDFDPRLIDIYQLGTLACRLVTGGSIREYMYTLDARQQLPADLALLLDRMLGHSGDDRIAAIDELVKALSDVKIQDIARADAADVSSHANTPPDGSIVGRDGDTPPHGSALQSPQPIEDIPFEQLGSYRIIKLIGRGGMGDVYLAQDDSCDRWVAIKVLPSSMSRDENLIRRFHAEAASAAKISHPNVVPIYAVSSEDDGHQFFVMQYIDGYTLAERLARQRRLPTAEALDLLEQCLAGLGAAHQKGLIHRDVKPGNILIERESGRAVLVDFGLVRRMDGSTQLTATGMVMGTVDYIAPEQARGKKVDGRADIYALGVLLYQMLSGRLPFEAETLVAMIFQHAYEEPTPLAQAAPGLPRAVTQIVARMMAKEPEERYQSCEDVLADIQAFRDGRPLAPHELPGSLALHPTQAMAEPDLPEDFDELITAKRLRHLRNIAATIFRRHAPDFVKNLQNTTQQLDGAVATYERRCERLTKLLADARGIAAELSEQIEANISAATDAMQEAEAAEDEQAEAAAMAKKRDCDEHLAALRERAQQQQEQIDDIELQSNKAEATLAQLCSQRDVLAARMQTAQARQQMEGGGKPPRRRLRVALALGGLAIAIGVMMLMLLPWRPRPEVVKQDDPTPITMPVTAPTTKMPETLAEPAKSLPLVPRLNPKLPPDPVMLMTFEKNTIKQSFDTIESVRNLAGPYGHGEGRSATWTPNGKVGGAFTCENGYIKIPRDLRNWKSEYTFFAWVKPPKGMPMRIFSEYDSGIIAKISVAKEGNVYSTASNVMKKVDKYGQWVAPGSTPVGLVPPNQWSFIAVTLTEGDVGKGKLRFTINDKSYDSKLQKLHGRGTGERSCHLGHGNDPCNGMIDEFGFYDRALSDAEIKTIYQMGLDGENLAEMVPDKNAPIDLTARPIPVPSKPQTELVPRLNPKLPPDPLMVMTFEKNTIMEGFGNILGVRNFGNSSTHGEGGNGTWTPNGKVGGALHSKGTGVRIAKGFLTKKKEYTITGWFLRTSKHHMWIYAERDRVGVTLGLAGKAGNLHVCTYSLLSKGEKGRNKWSFSDTPTGSCPTGQWVFAAATMRKGKRESGKLRITVNDKSFDFDHTMSVPGNPVEYAQLGFCHNSALSMQHGPGEGFVDEVTVYDRALSDAEIKTIYQMGLDGENLAEMVPDVPKRKLSVPLNKPPQRLAPRLNPNLPSNPVMLMTFEKDTIEEHFDNIERVRNMAGAHSHSKGHNAVWTPNGKVGGAFACTNGYIQIPRALRNHKSEYTIFAWIKPCEKKEFRVFTDFNGGPVGQIHVDPDGRLCALAWNKDRKGDAWAPHTMTPAGMIPLDQWTFIALTLTDGGVDKGKLRVTVNHKSYNMNLQKIQGGKAKINYCHLGHDQKPVKGMIDEFGFYDRALSDAEIKAIYQMGLDGENLAEMAPFVPKKKLAEVLNNASSSLAPRLNPKLPADPLLVMTFEKDTILERFGNIMAVRNFGNSSIHGDGGNGTWMPEGKVGGAMKCKGTGVQIANGLLTNQKEYTITGWFKKPSKKHLWIYSERDHFGITYGVYAINNGLSVTTFNRRKKALKAGNSEWTECGTPSLAYTPDKWVFAAITFKADGQIKGKLRITVNDKSYDLENTILFADNPSTHTLIGYDYNSFLSLKNGPSEGLVDEVTVYDRALSDTEIKTIYQLGLDGENLAQMEADKGADLQSQVN